MEEQLISFKTAKLAKDKGFNIHCRTAFSEDGGTWENEDFPYNSFNDNIFAPTQSLLQKWLRDEYGAYVEINCYTDSEHVSDKTFKISLILIKQQSNIESYAMGTYEEVLEAGLFEALKLINNGE